MEQQSFAEREGEFLNFLLVAGTTQVLLLLKKLTKSQVNAFSEIAYNILHTEIDGALVGQLKKHSHLLRHLGDRKASIASRRSLIVRHPLNVIKILRLVECLLPYDVAEICDGAVPEISDSLST